MVSGHQLLSTKAATFFKKYVLVQWLISHFICILNSPTNRIFIFSHFFHFWLLALRFLILWPALLVLYLIPERRSAKAIFSVWLIIICGRFPLWNLSLTCKMKQQVNNNKNKIKKSCLLYIYLCVVVSLYKRRVEYYTVPIREPWSHRNKKFYRIL